MVETICALATPEGRSALGLIRVSGPKSKDILLDMAGRMVPVRAPTLLVLKNRHGYLLDEVVVTLYQAPTSYTGEDMLEISAHGNPVILRAIIGEIVSRETCRMAQGGEFTQRALVNAKISLDRVEALDRLINASSEKAVQKALQAKLGGLGRPVKEISERLIELLADFQSQLDFSDMEVGSFVIEDALPRLASIKSILLDWLHAFKNYKQLFERRVIVLVGAPNVGKSSLFNAILGLNKAIVHESPGTTRDYLEHPYEENGIPLLLVDTAGLRSAQDPVEAMGVMRSRDAIARANIVCWVSDCYEDPDEEIASVIQGKTCIKVASKSDRSPAVEKNGWINVSAVQNLGLDRLRAAILPDSLDFGEVLLMSERQVEVVSRATKLMEEVEALLHRGEYLDYTTSKLLEATRALETIVEEIPNSEVLKSIFSRFCIGK